MQFHSDLLDELHYVAMGPFQNFRQQSRAEAFERTGEILQSIGLDRLLG